MGFCCAANPSHLLTTQRGSGLGKIGTVGGRKSRLLFEYGLGKIFFFFSEALFGLLSPRALAASR
jgi:hypothetical protein